LVTAPINKQNIQQEGFNFPGHTEYLQEKIGLDASLMLMVHEDLRIGVITVHILLKDGSSSMTVDAIINKVRLMNHSLKQDFWIQKPKIAILSLNPHAGDQGLIGDEDDTIVSPAIQQCLEEDMLCFGPYPADA